MNAHFQARVVQLEAVLQLGCVKEVNELELVVSLPNGLQGFVQVTEVCDAYTQKLNEQVAQEEPLEVRAVRMQLALGLE